MLKASHSLLLAFLSSSLLQTSCSKILEPLNADNSKDRRFSAKDYSLERSFRVFSKNFLSDDLSFITHVAAKDAEQAELINQFKEDWLSYLNQVGSSIPIVAPNAGVLPSAEEVANYYTSWKENGGSAFKNVNPFNMIAGENMPSGSLNGFWKGSEVSVSDSQIPQLITVQAQDGNGNSLEVTYNSMSVLPVSGYLFDVGYIIDSNGELTTNEDWNEWLFTLQCAKANVTVGDSTVEKTWALYFGKYDEVIDTANYSSSFGTFYSLLRKRLHLISRDTGNILQATPPDFYTVYSIQDSQYTFSFISLENTVISPLNTPKNRENENSFGFAFPGYSLNFRKESISHFYSLLNINQVKSVNEAERVNHYYTISHDAGSFARVSYFRPISDERTFPRISDTDTMYSWLIEGQFRENQPDASQDYSPFHTWTDEFGWKPLPEIIGKHKDFSETGVLYLDFSSKNIGNFYGVSIHSPGVFNHSNYADIELGQSTTETTETLLFLETDKFNARTENGKDIKYYADKVCENIHSGQ